MILAIVRNGFRALRRDRGALILSFILPIAFFSIFGLIFGGMHDTTPRVKVLVVDEDRSEASGRLVRGLLDEAALRVSTRSDARPAAQTGEPAPPEYTAAAAEAMVRRGDAPAALIIPRGFGAGASPFGPGAGRKALRILHDSSDPVAAQVVAGMAQKVVMTGGRGRDAGGLAAIEIRDVVGERKRSPMVAFYAAGIGVMFLMFTASSAGGSLLEEAESGALDRILSARVSMTTLLAGKVAYCTLLACAQLTLMFLWAWAVFHVDLFTHLPGFFVMTVATAFAVAAFGMLLASLARTRAQLGAISTLIILTMSAVGGSMFPRFLMPEGMKKLGLFTFNAWAIDGYTKVFWRDEPISHLVPQVAVLIGSGIVLFLLARRFARRWEYA